MKIRILHILLFCLISVFEAFSQKPVPGFSNDINSGCDIAVVRFTDLSTNNPTSWKWDFGNGVTSILQNPTCAYTNPGTYSVKLIAYNASGSDSVTKNNLITVFRSPTAQYSADKMFGCFPLSISVSDISTPGSSAIVTRQWDFGNGSSGTGANTSVTYNSAGSFFISLHIIDANGCEKYSINTDSVRVNAKPNALFTSDNQASCNAPFTVNFTNQSTGQSALTYLWSFGDGTTSASLNPSHTYNATGSYDVSLTVTDTSNCTDVSNNPAYINITGIVNYVADFSYTDTSGCSSNVHFTDLSSVGTNQWLWSFGDGSTSNLKNPSHSYAASGTYTVTLTASNNLSCANKSSDTRSKTIQVTINTPSAVDFSMDDSTGCNAPFTVQFTNAAPTATSYSWDFGDGNTSTLANPSHTFTMMGTYNVTLTITDANGCTSTKTKHVFISLPDPDFRADTTKGCAPLMVHFTDLSTSNYTITNWEWDFGNGNTSNLQNPPQLYQDSGSFTVSLKVTDSQGCQNTVVKNEYITPGIKPVTSFFAIDTLICHGAQTYFNSTSSSYAERWNWDFGDGSHSGEEDPEHRYQDTGTFDVQIVAEFHGCYDTVIRQNYIQVMPPIPMFTANPLSSCSAPLNVNFTNLSVGAETYIWKFGDGSANSTDVNPSHTYTLPGLYSVTLLATTSTPKQCTDSMFFSKYIKISESEADYTQNTGFNCENGTIDFSSISTTNTVIYQYIWDFGDGQIDTVQTPDISHQYDSTGIFDVKLTVLDSLGCASSITKPGSIEIQKKPKASFVADTTKGCVSLSVNFDPSASEAYAPATLSQWRWTFGDGTPIQIVNNGNIINHVYNTRSYPGSYNVRLTVVDSKGCFNTLTKNNYITPTFPFPDISYNSIICHYDSLQIINNSTGIGLRYFWDFGDGNTSTLAAPVHTYSVAGTQDFNITLTVSDTNNCDSTIILPIRVSRPIAKFDHDPITSNCPPIFVKFNDLSTSDVNQWNWTFGDQTIGSILQNPQHVYNKAGLFDATLTVTNNYGCVDIDTIKNIQINGPKGSIDYNPKQGCAPLTVNFTSQTQDATQFLWVFGNGDIASGQNVTYTYPDSGTFYPILNLSDTGGCSFNVVGTDPINVYPRPDADFLHSTECLFNPVSYTDLSQTYQNDAITNWNWSFGDTQSSGLQNPTHTFVANGNYNSTLIITTARGCKDTATQVVDVFNPSANFSFQNQCIFTPVQFTDQSNSPNLSISTRKWDFGDGDTSDQINPVHTYNQSGNFNVTLIVMDSRGCSDTTIKVIQIFPQPVADFTNPRICPLQRVVFTNASADNTGITSSSWQFGDGNISDSTSPGHIYQNSGSYLVNLIVSSGNACFDTITKTILVNPLPIANFTGKNICENLSNLYLNTSTISGGAIVTRRWDMNNGIVLDAPGDSLLFTYVNSGSYQVELKVVSDSGCFDSITKTIQIFDTPKANFSSNIVCAGSVTSFLDLSTPNQGSIISWQWDFGDTTNGMFQHIQHTYDYPGNHSVNLKVTTSLGCIHDTTINAYVKYNPVAGFEIPDSVCENEQVLYQNTSQNPADGIIDTWKWNFGDFNGSDEREPTHAYPVAGTYDIDLIASADNSCSDSIRKSVLVLRSPLAQFIAEPLVTTLVHSEIKFTNQSVDGVHWLWEFGDSDTSTLENPKHEYADTGTYKVVLYAYNIMECPDSVTVNVKIEPEFTFYIPNSFTPSNDGINEVFNGSGICIAEYELRIYNRWGELTFLSNDKNEGWNGRMFNTKEKCPIGVYSYVFDIVDYKKGRHRYIGSVTLVR